MAARLQDLFLPSRIRGDLAADDRAGAFEELVDFLVARHALSRRDAILEAITVREAKMSTGIKPGIAIPHARTSFTRGVIGVLGVSRRGIDYGSLDGAPVHLLFLLVSAEDAAAAHLAVLKRIAILVEGGGFLHDVRAAGDPAAIHALIARREQGLKDTQ